MNNNEQLQKRVELLEKQMASLNQSSTITYQVENAFMNRGFVDTLAPVDAPSGAEIAGMGFIEEIALSGLPETISVPAYPRKFLTLKNNYSGYSSSNNIYIPVYYL